jgi:hypothetical protein
MNALPLEPVHAGYFEELFVQGWAVSAFPRGRNAALAAGSPHVSVLVLVDGRQPALDTLAPPDSADIEVLVLDGASPVPGECVRFAAAAENRVLYRTPVRIPRADAWRILRGLARGHEIIEAVPQTRELAVLAHGDEVIADPSLLSAWGSAFGDDADATLVIGVEPLDVLLLAELASAVDGDVVAVVCEDAGSVRRLAGMCTATLTRRLRSGSCITPERLPALASGVSVEPCVRRQREELDELVAGGDLLEQASCLVVAGAELRDFLVGDPGDVLVRDLCVIEPLPHLRA